MGVRITERFPGQWWVYVTHKGKRSAKSAGDYKTALEAKRIIEQKLDLKPKKTCEIKTYFIQHQPSGLIKIGISQNPVKRLASLQTSSPDKLILLGWTVGNLEIKLHQKYKSLRGRGEWFKPNKEMLLWINSNTSTS